MCHCNAPLICASPEGTITRQGSSWFRFASVAEPTALTSAAVRSRLTGNVACHRDRLPLGHGIAPGEEPFDAALVTNARHAAAEALTLPTSVVLESRTATAGSVWATSAQSALDPDPAL